CFFLSEFLIETLDEEIVLVIEHGLKTDATDIALRRSIDRITECHVVSGHGLRDRARRATYAKKSPCYFLPGANLGKRPILGGVEIDLEGLLVRSDLHLRIHIISLTAIQYHRKSRSRYSCRACVSDAEAFDRMEPAGAARHRRAVQRVSSLARADQTRYKNCDFGVWHRRPTETATSSLARRSSFESSRANHSAARRTSNRRACLEF